MIVERTSSGHFTFASTGSEMKLRAQFGGKLLNLAMASTLSTVNEEESFSPGIGTAR